MTEVLGHDCNGRPLRAGDRVVLINAGTAWRDDIGKEFTVVGRGRIHPVRACDIHLDDGCDAPDDHLRKIDRPETGDWSEVERATGWHPEREREEA